MRSAPLQSHRNNRQVVSFIWRHEKTIHLFECIRNSQFVRNYFNMDDLCKRKKGGDSSCRIQVQSNSKLRSRRTSSYFLTKNLTKNLNYFVAFSHSFIFSSSLNEMFSNLGKCFHKQPTNFTIASLTSQIITLNNSDSGKRLLNVYHVPPLNFQYWQTCLEMPWYSSSLASFVEPRSRFLSLSLTFSIPRSTFEERTYLILATCTYEGETKGRVPARVSQNSKEDG